MTTSISLHSYDAQVCIITMEPHSMRLGVAESTSHSQLGGRGACSPDVELAYPRRRRDIFPWCILYIFDCYATACITIMELDETRLNELAHWIHFAFATRRSGSLLTRRRVSESSPQAIYLSMMHTVHIWLFGILIENCRPTSDKSSLKIPKKWSASRLRGEILVTSPSRFRVSPVMTTSIPLRMKFRVSFYKTLYIIAWRLIKCKSFLKNIIQKKRKRLEKNITSIVKHEKMW